MFANKNIIKTTALALIFCLVLSCVAPGKLNFVSYATDNVPTYYEFKEFVEDTGLKSISLNYGAIERNEWDIYSDTYFYDRMNDNQKAFYDGLKASVEDFFFNEKDAKPLRTTNGGILQGIGDGVNFQGLTSDDALLINTIFANENPQYYFLDSAVAISTNQIGGMLYPCVYSEYAKALDRREYNKRFLDIVKGYISEIKAHSDRKNERQRYIHSMLAERLDYATTDRTKWGPHQSTATAVFTGKTVCAGYSETYALLCRAVGIPCICVTSSEHEWNMVQYGKHWYNVDLTNDDGGNRPKWRYYNISDKELSNSPHNIYYSLGLPEAMYNYDNTPKEDYFPVYRLLNKVNGEYLFTMDEHEKNVISAGPTWKYEKVVWDTPDYETSVPIYRLFNPRSGEHHYTTDEYEVFVLSTQKGWNNEGIKFYSAESDGIPVYRLFNPRGKGPGNHYYTTEISEVIVLMNQGWRDEGICWYGVK